MSYDQSNIFARILRKEIPATVIFETDHVLAFNDVRPQAPIHVLIIPKGYYENAGDFYGRGADNEILAYHKGIAAVIDLLDLKGGYRLITNCGINSGQEVPHFHTHLLGGKSLGPMIH